MIDQEKAAESLGSIKQGNLGIRVNATEWLEGSPAASFAVWRHSMMPKGNFRPYSQIILNNLYSYTSTNCVHTILKEATV